MKRLEQFLHLDARTVAGTLGEGLEGAEVYNDDVIRPLDKPIAASGGTAILYGNIAPDGCVIKPPAAEPRLLQHTGPALVFDSYDEMSKAVNDLDLDVTPDHIMVLRNAGPIGGPGMPEWGMLPIPKKLLQAGRARHAAHLRCAHERHELRRLHPARLAGIRDRRPARGRAHGRPDHGRRVAARSIHLHARRREIAERAEAWSPPPRDYPRGYYRMFVQHARQAHEGCDFDYLEGAGGIPEPEIH